MLITPAGSAALDAVANKSLIQPFLCFIPVTALCALQARRAGRDWGYSHPTESGGSASSPRCTQAASKPRALRRGEGAVGSADLFWGSFIPWSLRHAVP